MGGWLDRFGALLLDAGLAAWFWTGVMALGLVVCRQPARRRGLARSALLGALLLWAMMLVRPLPPWNLIDLLDPYWPVPTITPRPRTGLRWLAVLYLLGAGLSLAWLGLGWLAGRRLVRRLNEPDPEVLGIYRGLAFPRRWDRPRLGIDPAGRRPMLVGFVRPRVVIPAALTDPGSADALRLCLRHELAHAAHLDPIFGLVGGLAQATWFFVAPLWWIQRVLRRDQEFLADRSVAFGPRRTPSRYAASLVRLASPAGDEMEAPSPSPPNLVGGLAIGSDGSPLFVRVLMLLKCPFRLELFAPFWWRWLMPPLAIVGTLLASTLSLQGFDRLWAATTDPHAARTLAHGRFTVSRMTVRDGSEKASRSLVLPVALPSRFTLRFEMLATRDELAELEIAGCRLVLESPPDRPEDAPAWHRVELIRDDHGPHATVDDRPVPCAARPRCSTADTNPLRFRGLPPHESQFRRLVLIW